jgi:hypothetical protein
MRALGWLSVLWLVSACGRPCPRADSLTGLDGGAVACVLNTDCPRPSSVLVCGQEEDKLRDCIACTDNLCVRYRPEACQ